MAENLKQPNQEEVDNWAKNYKIERQVVDANNNVISSTELKPILNSDEKVRFVEK